MSASRSRSWWGSANAPSRSPKARKRKTKATNSFGLCLFRALFFVFSLLVGLLNLSERQCGGLADVGVVVLEAAGQGSDGGAGVRADLTQRENRRAADLDLLVVERPDEGRDGVAGVGANLRQRHGHRHPHVGLRIRERLGEGR